MGGLKGYRPKFGYDIRINPESPRAARQAQRCSIAGCAHPAESRAPRTRENMSERVWFCRDHLRAHNASWNYFAGMDEDEIRRHCVEAVFGHRPTWPFGKAGTEGNGRAGAKTNGEREGGRAFWTYRVEDGYAIFDEEPDTQKMPRRPRLTKGQIEALGALGLGESASLHQIKARYKELVKRFHPDTNGGARGTEDRLRQVIKAYGHLRATGYVRNAR